MPLICRGAEIPYIQDGFSGPGTSLIEKVRYRLYKMYVAVAPQIPSASACCESILLAGAEYIPRWRGESRLICGLRIKLSHPYKTLHMVVYSKPRKKKALVLSATSPAIMGDEANRVSSIHVLFET